MEVLGIAGIAAITVICMLVGQGVKCTGIENKWIPVISGVLGGILGVVGMYTMPNFPMQDIISAIAVGIVSGLGATGLHQVYKQLTEGE